ncbi:hypothetical protein BN8_00440 [Fibrisoma limi BUZ 3]|uniref:Putative restriction endonuclease domain-containing protein n=1 Tax=Fibrisoma limi BUZ 3 TaxID=1185876 RepID=I2GC88_9BACT|nr:Uma2 family endonuclease [Fibrisoma limi]CCH51512.1 hypothetical protein BN8_00440 [Fibrisoma limi BUZ 3]
MEVEVKKISVAEFQEMEFDENDSHLYELINGELVKRKAPTPQHQRLSIKLSVSIHTHVEQHKLGQVYYAPIDVFLDDHNSPQPDLVFVAADQLSIITKNGIEGVPALVVEIISPTSIIRDRVTKKELYERSGVQEYWLVDPQNQEIEIYTLQDGQYVLLSAASSLEGELKSAVLPGLSIDTKTLFS